MFEWIAAGAVFGASFGITYLLRGRSTCRECMDEVVRLKIMYDMMRPEPRPARADDIVMQILQMVSAGPVTVRVIYTRLGQSREHISRVVKKMSEDGYLERGGGRPYRYGITRMGQARLDL